jgi:hypothetical protein
VRSKVRGSLEARAAMQCRGSKSLMLLSLWELLAGSLVV